VFCLLLVLFTLVPLGELALLLQVKESIGIGPTLGLVLFTGVVGAALAKRQGLEALRRIHEDMAKGATPAAGLLDGALILVAGAVLVTPGIVTDIFGFALLLPPVRRGLGSLVARWAKAHIVVHTGGPLGPSDVIDAEVVRSGPTAPGPLLPPPGAQDGPDEVIDVEFETR
jgi:UPF0716 protein FxsA